jgi:DNA invertase Pin-like site-specific DNA recombinase
MKKAFAYLRTSSAANVGADKDSEKRQRAAIEAFADREQIEVIDWFNDPAVRGSDPIAERPGFGSLLQRIANNGVRIVIVEDASRFARHLLTQEAGIALLVSMGVRVLTANGDDLTDSDDEFRVAMRQILGVFSQLEKTRLVKKLKGARDRKKAQTGKCGGRRAHAELRPEAVALARRLRAQQMSLREVSAQLATAGFVNARGCPFAPKSIRAMIGPPPTS